MKTISDSTLVWKNEKFVERNLKNLTISYFWLKRIPFIKCQKIILLSRHLYHEVYKLSQNFTEGNTREVSACFFVCLFVTSYNFEMTTRAWVSEFHWRQWRFRNWTPLVVDISLRFIARDFRVDFLKIVPSRYFENSSRAVKKLWGATLTWGMQGGFYQKKVIAFKGQATKYTTIKLSI